LPAARVPLLIGSGLIQPRPYAIGNSYARLKTLISFGDSNMLPDLDDLLTEALHHAKTSKQPKHPLARKLHEQVYSAHQAYLNEANWKIGKLIGIVHHAPDGTVTYLGVFREFIFTKTPARKLCPTTGLLCECEDLEHVSGQYWLAPVERIPPPEDHIEVLKARFYELCCDLGV
jgi:hypothetical protein